MPADVGCLRKMDSAKAHDPRAVANLVLDLADVEGLSVRHLKLQKLLYFAHGMFLIQTGGPLVSGVFEAWQHGPVHPAVYRAFRGAGAKPITDRARREDVLTGELTPLLRIADPRCVSTVRRVVDGLGRMSDRDLVDLSHASGGPWAAVVDNMIQGFALGARIDDDLIRARFARHKFVVKSSDAHREIGGTTTATEHDLGIEKPFSSPHRTR